MPGVINWTSAAAVLAVLLVALLGAGPMLAPLQVSARAGGLVAGHPAFNHGDFHRFGGRHLDRFGRMPRIVVGGNPTAIRRTAGLEPARAHRRIFGLDLPVTGIGVSFGPFDEPIDDVGVIDRPADHRAADGGSRIAQGGSRCRSETRIVASEDGGERPIRITRCRKG